MAVQSMQSTEQSSFSQKSSNTSQLQRKFSNGTAFGVLVVLALVWLIPLAWVITTSFKPEAETTIVPLTWWSNAFNIDAYIKVLQAGDMPRWYFNSIFTSVVISAASVLISSTAAFAFSRVPFLGRGILFWVIIAGLMIPGQVLIVPLFSIMQSFGLVDTYWGIILPQIASPFAMFIFKQYFDGIPHEYDEAARVDGCSRWRTYWQIWMPLSTPIIATVAIFAFVGSWNNFVWPFVIITGTDMMTIPVGLATVQSSYGIRYAQIMASAVLAGLPAVIVFAFFQRQIVQGLAGGLKE